MRQEYVFTENGDEDKRIRFSVADSFVERLVRSLCFKQVVIIFGRDVRCRAEAARHEDRYGQKK